MHLSLFFVGLGGLVVMRLLWLRTLLVAMNKSHLRLRTLYHALCSFLESLITQVVIHNNRFLHHKWLTPDVIQSFIVLQ